MERTAEVSSRPHASTSRARPTMNTWIVIALVLILIVAFIVVELHIRRRIKDPGHLQQNGQIQSRGGPAGGVCPGRGTALTDARSVAAYLRSNY